MIGKEDRAAEIVAVDEALSQLAQRDERLSRVVELRFFGGLSVEETAEVLGVNARTIKRDWRKARDFLYQQLVEDDALVAQGDEFLSEPAGEYAGGLMSDAERHDLLEGAREIDALRSRQKK